MLSEEANGRLGLARFDVQFGAQLESAQMIRRRPQDLIGEVRGLGELSQAAVDVGQDQPQLLVLRVFQEAPQSLLLRLLVAAVGEEQLNQFPARFIVLRPELEDVLRIRNGRRHHLLHQPEAEAQPIRFWVAGRQLAPAVQELPGLGDLARAVQVAQGQGPDHRDILRLALMKAQQQRLRFVKVRPLGEQQRFAACGLILVPTPGKEPAERQHGEHRGRHGPPVHPDRWSAGIDSRCRHDRAGSWKTKRDLEMAIGRCAIIRRLCGAGKADFVVQNPNRLNMSRLAQG